MKAAMTIVAALLALTPASALALLSVKAGTYELASRVFRTSSGLVAVYNARTHSERAFLLTGPEARDLAARCFGEGTPKHQKWVIRFSVPSDSEESYSPATLLSYRPLASEKEKVPLFVGEDLAPLK